MATEMLPSLQDDPQPAGDEKTLGASLPLELRTVLLPLASLKFTVVLFAMAIFIVLAGTFAQWQKDVNEVIDEFFRMKFRAGGSWGDWFSTLFVRIDFQIFFPPSFFPSRPQVGGAFYFPKGWLIGVLMAVNLLAAHTLRFKFQAKGTRLLAGLGLIGFGVLVTWAVIASGSNPDGMQEEPLLSFRTLWSITNWMLKLGLIAGAAGLCYFAWTLQTRQAYLQWLLYIGAAVLLLADAWFTLKGDAATLNDSSMRILWLLVKATLSSCVLLAGCALVFRKRAGIVLLHAGVGLMMFNELLVGTTHKEAQMMIEEGQTINYVQNINANEIAIIDSSDPKQDHVVVVPLERLQVGETLSDEQLPFDLTLVELFKNSRLEPVPAGAKNPATVGSGLYYRPRDIAQGTGTDVGGQVDLTSLYVKLTGKDGKDLGTRLLGLELTFGQYPEVVETGGKTYDVGLRFERTYKPYSVHLIDLHKDDYVGTNTVKNYSSDIRLVDAERNVDRQLSIWMNNPLRFAGETFYQSNYHLDPAVGIETTTLQVVRNNGWMIPYVSCMIVVVGMLGQFGQVLVRFLRRREREQQEVPLASLPPEQKLASRGKRAKNQAEGSKRKNHSPSENLPVVDSSSQWIAKYFPAVVAGMMGLWLISTWVPRGHKLTEMNLTSFGELPLAYEGRVKPFDTLARTSLRQISGKQTYKDNDGRTQPAIRWLLDLATNMEAALEYKVFRIDNPEVLGTLNLEPRSGYCYALSEFRDKLPEIQKQVVLAEEQAKKDKGSLSVYQRKIMELNKRLMIVRLLIASLQLPEVQNARDLMNTKGLVEELLKHEPPLAIPLATEAGPDEVQWKLIPDAVVNAIEARKLPTVTQNMLLVLETYRKGDPRNFNEAVANYRRELESSENLVYSLASTRVETAFNAAEPFYRAMLAYGIAFVLAAVGLLGWSKPLNRAAFWTIVVTLVYHTLALYARMEISGRPPVTNLYSSAIFIGWGCVVLGLILESVFRIGIGNMVAAATGGGSLLIAHLLTTSVPDHMGDTMIVMQAVLDTQFWLATHVVCITMGYATTFLSGFLGVIYILIRLLSPMLFEEMSKKLIRMIYGTLCFAIVFSFFGTVLGGLWADDSWGRFWGWDPKENGALIIVLWNALVLHARWDGMVKDRGLAALAVGGNIATTWSWFGVNELGVGMHSYGFTDGVLMALGGFVLVQLVLIGLAQLPVERWRAESAA